MSPARSLGAGESGHLRGESWRKVKHNQSSQLLFPTDLFCPSAAKTEKKIQSLVENIVFCLSADVKADLAIAGSARRKNIFQR